MKENNLPIDFEMPLSLNQRARLLLPTPLTKEEFELIEMQLKNALEVSRRINDIEKSNLETPTK